MESTVSKLCQQLEATIKYLTPLLPLANCHMVEFLTQCHWEKLLPKALKETLDRWDLNEAVDRFWIAAEDPKVSSGSELDIWIANARSHCIVSNGDFCLTADQLQDRIRALGGDFKPEIRIKEYMTSKKSYEVGVMSRVAAALTGACGAACCVEAGGGRGALLAPLSVAHALPALTLDCQPSLLAAAERRAVLLQKKWHTIAKTVKDGDEDCTADNSPPRPFSHCLHRFAQAYVTRRTDLAAMVRASFPELAHTDIRLLLTGLHTCGNLGPDSLRMFADQPAVAALLNVPCCYHLLSEAVDGSCFDVFQRNYGGDADVGHGFPMSEHLKGYNLGRNARMLAAQSIDRVVSLRQLPAKSLLYRALLQVIIKQHLPDYAISEGKLKRVGAKCDNFEQYFKMADSILNLELMDRLPDSLNVVCKDIDSQWKKLVLFYLLRLCLAQVVESVILLDRLLFLYENGFHKAFLVKLFDPVLSPRCHSIAAVR